MSVTAWRIAIPVLGVLFNTGLTVSGFVNFTVALVCWGAMVPVVLTALFWPQIAPWLERRMRARLGTTSQEQWQRTQQDALKQVASALESQAVSRPRTEAEELRHSCQQLATELRQLVEECVREKDKLTRKVENAETEEEWRRASYERDDPNSVFRGLARFKYESRFRNRAMRLLEEAVRRGWVDPTDVTLAEHGGNDFAAMGGVARILDEIGGKSSHK